METMRVTPAGGDRFAIALRGHEIMVDQPAEVASGRWVREVPIVWGA